MRQLYRSVQRVASAVRFQKWYKIVLNCTLFSKTHAVSSVEKLTISSDGHFAWFIIIIIIIIVVVF